MRKINKKTCWFRLVLFILLFPIIFVWLVCRKIKYRGRKINENIDVFNMSQIDELTGIEFENLLKQIFEKQGYVVVLTKKSHDYGADLILKRKGCVAVVQAKCYSKNIGIKAIQEIIAAKKHYMADEMFVASNRYFSKDAVVLASEHDVRLIDRDVIMKLVREYSPKIEVEGKKYVAMNDAQKQEMEKKYRFWI